MKQCPNCHISYSDDHLFCTECGASLVEAPPPPPEPVTPPPVEPAAPDPLPEPAEPTIQIPPIQPPRPAPSAPVGDPFVPPPPVKKKGQIPAAVLAVPIVIALVAIVAAAFGWLKVFQLQGSLEDTLTQLSTAEQGASDIQAQLDKLQLEHDKTSDALDEATTQLEDARGQLEDVSGQLTDGSSRLDEVEAELGELLALLDSGYGFGSTDYYASKGVVVVQPYSSESVTIYESAVGDTTFTYHTPGYGFSCQWDNESFSGGRNSVTITGEEPGYYILSFTNDRNSDAFDILVIVTDY